MPIQFQCWQCQKPLSSDNNTTGSRIACPFCGTTVTVPAGPATVLHTAANESTDFAVPCNGPEANFPVAAPAPRVPPVNAAPAPPPCVHVEIPQAPAPQPPMLDARWDSPPPDAAGGGLRTYVAGGLILACIVGFGAAVCVLIAVAFKSGEPPRGPSQPVASAPKEPAQEEQRERPAPVVPVKPAAPPEKPAPPPEPAKQPPEKKVEPAPPPPPAEKDPPRKKDRDPAPPEIKLPPPEKDRSPEVAKAKEPEAPRKLKVKRRSDLTAEDLRKQLLLVTEVALDAPHAPQSSRWILETARAAKDSEGFDLAPQVMLRRPDLHGLPMTMGLSCRLGKEPAEALQALSRRLRRHLEAAIPGAAGGTVADPRPDPDKLRARLTGDAERNAWLRPEAIPTLLQLLMAEGRDVRLILVEVLAQIKGREASVALAQRALLDLDADVREAALTALQDRPRADYEAVLLSGFQYPWAAVADHAAEAVVALGLRDAASKLVLLLDGKDVSRPFTVEVNKQRVTVVQEMVRINHLGNCLMCHAPSQQRSDLVRGRVPIPGEVLPAPVTSPQYYEGDRGIFVRADVTYLKQDFSVHQPVLQPKTWPAHQRYDYMVRRRPLAPEEVAGWHREAKERNPISPRKEALMFALRELTQKDAGPLVQDWKRLYDPISGESAGRPLSPEEQARQLRTAIVEAPPARQAVLLDGYNERDGGVYDAALALAIPELGGKLQDKARAVLVERLAWAPLKELRRRLADSDAELRRAAVLACAVKQMPALIADVKVCLNDPDATVAQAATAVLARLDTSFVPDSEVRRLRGVLTDAAPDVQAEMLHEFRASKGTVYTLALAQAIPDLPASLQKKGRDALADRLIAGPLADLRDRLRDKDREMRLASVMASRLKQVKSLVPDLIPCLGDKDSTIVWEARRALKGLTGQDVGPAAGATAAERETIIRFWREWWKKRAGG